VHHVRIACLLPAAALAALIVTPAHAIDRATCNNAFENAQKLRDAGKLVETRVQLHECARPECTIVRADCTRWEAELVDSLPSVVIHAHETTAGDVVDVRVSIDGVVVATELAGRPLDVDPGLHRFTFERASDKTVESQIMVVTGEKNRQLRVDLVPAAAALPTPSTPAPPPSGPPPAPPPASPSRPVPLSVWILGSIGAAGLASFAGWGIHGEVAYSGLEGSCGHDCSPSQVSPVKTDMAIADVSLLVGVLAVGTGAVLFLTRPTEGHSASALYFEPLGPGLALGGVF
jgi:hypothetical protein